MKAGTMRIELLIARGAGAGQHLTIPRRNANRAIRQLIGCECLDVVNLRDGRVMLVDDTGKIDHKPVNPRATEMFRNLYPLHAAAKSNIHGDVVIATDADFAKD